MHTDDTKQRISNTMKGKHKTPEHAAKCRVASSGKVRGPRNPAHVEKIRRGNINAKAKRNKASWDVVDQIRLLHRIGVSQKIILTVHFPELSKGIIGDIVAERTWKPEYRPEGP